MLNGEQWKEVRNNSNMWAMKGKNNRVTSESE